MKRFINILFALFLCISFAEVQAGKISVKVTPVGSGGKIEVGDKFYVIVEAWNCQGQWNFPETFGGARLMYTPQQNSTSYSESDGRNKVTQSYNRLDFILMAEKAGSYSFGPVSMGNTKCSPVKYTIYERGKGKPNSGGEASGGTDSGSLQANSQQGSGPQFIGKGNENMFLRASLSKTNVYEQEALVYTIKLYTSYNYIKFIGATAAPKFEGFVVEESKVSDAQYGFESVNGKTYKAAVVARYIIFPQKSGRLTIKGNTYTVSADAFEYYQDPVYQRMTVKRPVQLNLTPNDIVVDVKALPSPRPSDYSGGVGNFTITSSLPSQQFKTNQAAEITYTVKGTGNLKYIKLPELNNIFPSQLEVFTPETQDDTKAEGSNVSGSVSFKYSFIPTETGTFEIPEVKLVYFDPSSNSYKTTVAKGYRIEVGKGSASDKSQKAMRFDNTPQQVNLKKLEKEHTPMVYNFSFWLWFIIPFVALISALIYSSIYQSQHADMAGLKSRRAGKMARRRLRKAYECKKKGDSSRFYDEMLAAIWGFLGHRLKMPTSELTRQNVTEVLSSHNVSDDTIQSTITLLDDCEFAKYAPSAQVGNMDKVYERGVELIQNLNSAIK